MRTQIRVAYDIAPAKQLHQSKEPSFIGIARWSKEPEVNILDMQFKISLNAQMREHEAK